MRSHPAAQGAVRLVVKLFLASMFILFVVNTRAALHRFSEEKAGRGAGRTAQAQAQPRSVIDSRPWQTRRQPEPQASGRRDDIPPSAAGRTPVPERRSAGVPPAGGLPPPPEGPRLVVLVCEAESLWQARNGGARMRDAQAFYGYRREEAGRIAAAIRTPGNRYESEFPGVKEFLLVIPPMPPYFRVESGERGEEVALYPLERGQRRCLRGFRGWLYDLSAGTMQAVR